MTEDHRIAESVRAKISADIQIWANRLQAKPSASVIIKLLLIEPGFQFIFLIRLWEAFAQVPVVGRFIRRLLWYFSVLVFNCDVGAKTEIGGGLYMPHPLAIVVHGNCRIGKNVVLLHSVTLGLANKAGTQTPTLEDNVVVNAGACILGGVTIRSGAVIGANAVVLVDVPPGASAVGVPARVILTNPML